MKKILGLVLLIMVFLLPLKVDAAKIKTSSLDVPENVKKGDTFNIPLTIDYFGVDSTLVSSFGIGSVTYDIVYDDKVFTLIKVSADGFDTYYDKDNKVVESVITKDGILSNTCVDSVLYCGEYKAILTFYVNDTEETSSIIKVNDVVTNGYQLDNGVVNSYEKDKIVSFSTSITKSGNITIINNTSIKEMPKVELVTLNGNIDDLMIITSKEKKESIISDTSKLDNPDSNNYLKSIEIDGYSIDFYKRVTDYTLEVDKNVNKLIISPKLDDERATLEIVGADDLSGNNNQVLIKVKAQDGSVRIYTINVSKSNTTVSDNGKASIKEMIINIYNNNKIIILCIAGVILLGIIIAIIVNKVNDNKLKAKIDDF